MGNAKMIKRLVTIMAMMMVVLCGCSTADVKQQSAEAKETTTVVDNTDNNIKEDEETTEADEADKVTETETDVKEVEETSEPEVETVSEADVESEAATYETAYDCAYATWSADMEPTIVAWNKNTKEYTKIESGDKYIVKDGDELILVCDLRESWEFNETRNPYLKWIPICTLYDEFEFLEVPKEVTECWLFLNIDGEQYDIPIVIISENADEAAMEEFENYTLSE